MGGIYILVIDADQLARELIQYVLKKEGYSVETTDNPHGALQMIRRREPDLILLEVVMPSLDGFQLTEKLREEGYDTPLIFLTAMNALSERLNGFRSGADDYIGKPYDPRELVARIRAVLRRAKKLHTDAGNQLAVMRIGQVELIPADLKVALPSRSLDLTHTEMRVLRTLMKSANQVVSRRQLLNEVWEDDSNRSNIVEVFVSRLRLKMKDDVTILSIRGVGYKFVSK